jgi:excisionase family DNA binding protein
VSRHKHAPAGTDTVGCGPPYDRADPPVHLSCMKTNNSTLSGLEPLLSIDELADYLHVPVTTIRDWRTDGKGPCAIKAGGRVRFATSDVLAWLVRQRESEPGHGPSGG